MGRQAVPPPPGGGYTGVQTSHRSGRPLLVPVKTMAWIRRKAEKIACRTTVRMLKLVRKGHTNRPHTHLDRPRGQAGLQAHPVTVMAVASTAGTASTQSYVIIRHHVQPHASRDQRRGCGRPAQADPHAHQPPSGNSQKTAKPAILHPAGHAPRPMPRRSPRASDPHTGHIPIPPQSDHAPAETSGRLAQIFAPTSPANQLRRRSARRRRQRTAPPRDAASASSQWGPAFKPARRPAPAARGRGSPGNLDRLNSTKVRRRGAGSRRTDGRSRRPDPASRWRLGSQSPLLYFITYFLKCLADFLQVVVRLFQ